MTRRQRDINLKSAILKEARWRRTIFYFLRGAVVQIEASCSGCKATYQVSNKLAGRRAKCKRCGGIVHIPQSEQVLQSKPRAEKRSDTATQKRQAPDSTKPVLKPDGVAERQAEILAGFTGTVDKVKAPFTYRIAILLVGAVMILLPLVYIALIVAVCFGVYSHAIYNTHILSWGRGRAKIMAVLVYGAPMVIGSILILFMIKPLFARPSQQTRTRSLTRKGEPILFAFVDRICAAVGAPRPKQINADCEVNASASFRRGLLSVLIGGDLVLTVGIPLVAGLSLRQFAGVLAHEFGHFSQGAGMRLSYVIRSISHWFTRVVYERDEWDDWLSSITDDLDVRIAWVLYLSQLFVSTLR